MGNFIKKYQVIVFLSFLAGSLLLLKYNLTSAKTTPTTEVVPTPIITLIPTLTLVPTIQISPSLTATTSAATTSSSSNYEIIADKLMPLWRLLPYTGKGFVVESYIKEGVLLISLKEGTTKNRAMLDIAGWIMDNNVDPNTVKLEWK